MENLTVYLEGLFADVPHTKATAQAKAELLATMQDHYHAALATGLSPDEALGQTIHAVGSLDEVLAALDVERTAPTPANALSEQGAETYWHQTLRYAATLGLGVAMCIASVALVVLFSGESGEVAAGIFILAVAAGVALIIAAAMSYRPANQQVKRHAITPALSQVAADRLDAYQRPHMIGLIAGICCCICSIIGPMFFDDSFGVAIMLFMIAIGVFYLVYVQTIKNGYTRLAIVRPARH